MCISISLACLAASNGISTKNHEHTCSTGKMQSVANKIAIPEQENMELAGKMFSIYTFFESEKDV